MKIRQLLRSCYAEERCCTAHMDYNLYDGYVYVFLCFSVVCAVSGLTAFHTDHCRRCPGCVRLSLALRALNFAH